MQHVNKINAIIELNKIHACLQQLWERCAPIMSRQERTTLNVLIVALEKLDYQIDPRD